LALIVYGGDYFLIAGRFKRSTGKNDRRCVEEEQESLWSWEGFKSDLMVFFQSDISAVQAEKEARRRQNIAAVLAGGRRY